MNPSHPDKKARLSKIFPIVLASLWVLFTFNFGIRAGLWLIAIIGLLMLVKWIGRIAEKQWASVLARMSPAGRTTWKWFQRASPLIFIALWIWYMRWKMQQGEEFRVVLAQTAVILALGIGASLQRLIDWLTRDDPATSKPEDTLRS